MAPSPKSNTGSLAILALAALSAPAARSCRRRCRATGSTILYAGAALQTFSGLAHQTTTKTETLNCDCQVRAAPAQGVFEPVDTGFEAAGRELATTLAPTVAIDSWTVYFTATMSSVGSLIPTSYVWYIKDEDTDIVATVLIDSSGEAAGVGVLNSTTVYFTDTSGALWTIDNTGFEATEILSYDECDMTGEPSGMVLWEHTAQIFWTDLSGVVGDRVYSCSLDGTDIATVTSEIGRPYDVSLTPHEGRLYVSSESDNMIYRVDSEGTDLTSWLAVTTPRGVWCESTSDLLYFASYNDTYIGAAPMDDTTSITVVLNSTELDGESRSPSASTTSATSFYTTEESINVYSLMTHEQEVIAYLTGLEFLYVESYVAPTAAPTGMPTSMPTGSPTDAPVPMPTSIPQPKPTTVPTSAPIPLPTPSPTPIPSATPVTPIYAADGADAQSVPTTPPSPAPTTKPTAVPTSYPTMAPTPQPSPEPTGLPSAAPTLVPSAAPTGAPSEQPTPYPSALPSALPGASPTFLPTPSPTSPPSLPPSPAATSAEKKREMAAMGISPSSNTDEPYTRERGLASAGSRAERRRAQEQARDAAAAAGGFVGGGPSPAAAASDRRPAAAPRKLKLSATRLMRNALHAHNYGLHQNALEAFDAALGSPEGRSTDLIRAECMAHKAATLHAMGRHTDALACAEEAKRLDPRQPRACRGSRSRATASASP
ncbi:metalloendopeptidase [Aureococcus anophagefferens]|nr:metalloendopeptidase [Aureococcus anophagefferens]